MLLRSALAALGTIILLLLLGVPVQAGVSAEGRKGMVVSVSPPASEVGRAVLKKGGTAVDAAVATAFALAVTWPEAGNIGGGGFLLVRPAGKEPTVFDYREKAPAAASRDLFVRQPPTPHRLAGVPGTVAGLALAQRRFGKLPWKDLVLPAVQLAEEGFAIDTPLARSLNRALARARDRLEFRRVFGKDPGKGEWSAGDRLAQPDLARTLRLIADRGAEAFYKGPIAEQIVAEMKAGDGLITLEDLAGYSARERAPIHGTYRGYDVYAPPPPSSGGICLVEMLNILENFDLRKQGRYSAATLHLMTEAMRRAYCDRARYLGDSDFVTIPAHLTTKEYARKLAAGVDRMKATRSEDLAGDLHLSEDRPHTTHFSVIDGEGMAVSNTYTLESSFGAKVVVKGAGFLLNNEMGDFNPRPGVTTRGGLIGTPANEISPNKRMLSSMTPTLLVKDGKTVLITGSPGGRTIINTVLCIVLDVVDFDMPLREAIDAPRMHHGWFPDRLQVEPKLAREHAGELKTLESLGHRLAPRPSEQGDAHSIAIDPRSGLYRGEADRRRGGCALGW
jgi:gamma-glutamyltranspeptidase/glutathione hydrolase